MWSSECLEKNLTGWFGLFLGFDFFLFFIFGGFQKVSLTFVGLKIFYLFFWLKIVIQFIFGVSD